LRLPGVESCLLASFILGSASSSTSLWKSFLVIFWQSGMCLSAAPLLKVRSQCGQLTRFKRLACEDLGLGSYTISSRKGFTTRSYSGEAFLFSIGVIEYALFFLV